MRFYEITITDPQTSKTQVYTSYVNGVNDPGALNIIFDLNVVPFARTLGPSMIEIWGIPLQSISQASNLNNKNILVKGGFKKGLPLANPAQSGVLAEGFIVQAFGNWQGTDMTLNLIMLPGQVRPSSATTAAASSVNASSASANNATVAVTAQSSAVPADPSRVPTGTLQTQINGQFVYPKNSSMAAAVSNFLTSAMPGYTVDVNISSQLVWPYDQAGSFATVEAFARWLKGFTQMLLGGTYSGVDIRLVGTTFTVYDNSTKNTNIEFRDLIGQPTWIQPKTIQFKCPLRADLSVGNMVTLPPGYYGVSPGQALTQQNLRDTSAQKGQYKITELHHFGNFRQPDANSWATLVTCVGPY